MRKILNSVLLFSFLSFFAGCDSKKHPDITQEQIAKDLVGQNVPVGTTGWAFGTDEPIDVDITDVKSDSKNPDSKIVDAHIKTEGRWSHLKMAGNLRLGYTWANNSWKLTQIANKSFKPLENKNSGLKADGYTAEMQNSNSDEK